MTRLSISILTALVLTACPGESPADAGPADAAAPDDAGQAEDAGLPDAAEPADAGPPDAAEIPEQDFGWDELDPIVDAPAAQWAHLVADLGDGRALVFGGTDIGDFGGSVLARTYLFDANQTPPTFEDLTPVIGASPDARYCGCAAYHPAENKVVVQGGRNMGGLMDGTTWVFDLDAEAWTNPNVNGPTAGLGCSMTHFAGDGLLYLFAGASFAGSTNQLATYSIADNTWTTITATNPPPNRYDAELIALSDRLVIAGGAASAQSNFYSDVWSYDPDTTTWTELLASSTDPIGRRVPWVRVAPDETHFYFGFGNNFGAVLDDVWRFDFADNTFTEVTPAGDAPTARGFSQALPGGRGDIGVLLYGFDMANPVDSIWRLRASSEEVTWW